MTPDPLTEPIAYGLAQLQAMALPCVSPAEQGELLHHAFYAGAWLAYQLCKVNSLGNGQGNLMQLQALCDELEAFASLADSLVPAMPTLVASHG